MHQILKEIIAAKQKRVAERKVLYPAALLERSVYYSAPVVSMRQYLKRQDKSGIIAEVKRRSPVAGALHPYLSVEQVSIGYMQAGASALSILTDEHYFGGSDQDLKAARAVNFCPILRKDFIIDEYQVIEARALGADTILLIAAILSKDAVHKLAHLAHSLGMEVILEVHQREELDMISDDVDIIGVNNRDLNTFHTDVQHSETLLPFLPGDKVLISESGISSPEIAARLRKAGYHGFLIGTEFMRAAAPEKACARFVQSLKQLEHAT